jgi:hypothetical protein
MSMQPAASLMMVALWELTEPPQWPRGRRWVLEEAAGRWNCPLWLINDCKSSGYQALTML